MLLPSTRKHDNLKKSLSALQRRKAFRKPVDSLLPSSAEPLSLTTGKEMFLLGARPAELHRRPASGNRLAENIGVFTDACPCKRPLVTPKLFCHPAFRILPRLLFLLLLQSYADHPQGRRELLMPEQRQNHPTARPQGNSRLAALTSNGAEQTTQQLQAKQ